jgi:hypothetical protein
MKICNTEAVDMNRVAVRYLVEEILSRDASITLNDGSYKDVLCLSDSCEEILESLTYIDEDYLIASNSDGAQLGWFCLIYGKSNSNTIVIGDYLNTAFCKEVYDQAGERLDRDMASHTKFKP